MILRWCLRIVSSLNDERVSLVADDIDLRDQKSVHVPRNSPTDMTFRGIRKGLSYKIPTKVELVSPVIAEYPIFPPVGPI